MHRTGHASRLEESANSLLWATCLRQIKILPEGAKADALPTDVLYSGEKAYQFLLEVICGLHSPLAGETEVFGQFKDFVASIDYAANPELRFFRDIAAQLFLDAKKVRTKYLKGLGSQSYGSLARRWLATEENIHVLGAGRLVQDILPWLVKSKVRVSLYVRSPEKVILSDWFKSFLGKVDVYDYATKQPEQGGVIVCAPLRAEDIEQWMGSASITRILDLRGESELNPIQGPAIVQGLQQAFKKIEANKDRVSELSKKALEEIRELAAQINESQKVRPFGWDDLCA